jgi:DNA mismatch repair protein MutS
MGQLKNTLVDMLDIKIGKNKAIGIKNNNRDGYYLTLTTSRAKILKTKLDKLKKITVNDKEINTDILIFKDTGKTTKISFKTLGQKADDINKYLEQLDDLTKKHYLEYLSYFYDKYLSLIDKCNHSITQIDYLKSCSKLVSLYNYVRPTISNKKYGSVDATGLRHPIVERIIDYDYVAHDIKIGHDGLKGMLIYGLNSSGKSVMMKSIGLSIIMAQSGLFVPAKSFTFSPYHSLYTRITGNDNIFKGLSSFALEMMELNSILKRADEKTLVIGDEVCRGTEHISGNALVATTIIKLST